jgi:large subunit ribosomal protein L23
VVNSSFSTNNNSIHTIKYPLITDKATRLLEKNQYTFIVDSSSDKTNIKQSLEYLFNVKIIKINTCQLPKKQKRVGKFIGWKPHYKKAIVTLAEGNTINLFAEN